MLSAKRFLRRCQLIWLWVCAWLAGGPKVRVVIAVTQENYDEPWIFLQQIQRPDGTVILVPPMTELKRGEALKDCLDRLMNTLDLEVREMVPCAPFNPVSKYRPHHIYLTYHADLEKQRPKRVDKKTGNIWAWHLISELGRPHKPLLQTIIRRAGYGEYLERDPNKTPVSVDE